MFAFQWREFSPPLSSAHRLLQCYHSQWEIGDAAIPGEFPLSPRHYWAISQWASSLEWRHAVTLHLLVGKICISFFLFYCEGMLSLVVLWHCDTRLPVNRWFKLSLNFELLVNRGMKFVLGQRLFNKHFLYDFNYSVSKKQPCYRINKINK